MSETCKSTIWWPIFPNYAPRKSVNIEESAVVMEDVGLSQSESVILVAGSG